MNQWYYKYTIIFKRAHKKYFFSIYPPKIVFPEVGRNIFGHELLQDMMSGFVDTYINGVIFVLIEFQLSIFRKLFLIAYNTIKVSIVH